MEADMIDAIFLADAEVFQPSLHLHGRIACQREDTAVVLAAKECLLAVDDELGAIGPEVTHAMMSTVRV